MSDQHTRTAERLIGQVGEGHLFRFPNEDETYEVVIGGPEPRRIGYRKANDDAGTMFYTDRQTPVLQLDWHTN